jgi:phage terminase small subunit
MAKPKAIAAHLRPETQAWIANTQRDYTVEPHALMLLVLAGEAWDQGREAEAVLRRDGLIVEGREGGSRPHPCVAIARDARIAFARIIAQLGLSDAEVPEAYGMASSRRSTREGGWRSNLKVVK